MCGPAIAETLGRRKTGAGTVPTSVAAIPSLKTRMFGNRIRREVRSFASREAARGWLAKGTNMRISRSLMVQPEGTSGLCGAPSSCARAGFTQDKLIPRTFVPQTPLQSLIDHKAPASSREVVRMARLLTDAPCTAFFHSGLGIKPYGRHDSYLDGRNEAVSRLT